MAQSYREIAEKLQALFPEGTVQHSGKSSHIPVQVYMKRLEEAAGEFWSWSIIGNPVYQREQRAVIVTGELTILSTTRTGFGLSYYHDDKEPSSVTKYKNAVNSAESDALRSACDKFLMGWKDLAPFREWASNPGVFEQSTTVSPTTTNLTCTRCQNALTKEDMFFLELCGVKIPYCTEHVPNQFKKRIDKT